MRMRVHARVRVLKNTLGEDDWAKVVIAYCACTVPCAPVCVFSVDANQPAYVHIFIYTHTIHMHLHKQNPSGPSGLAALPLRHKLRRWGMGGGVGGNECGRYKIGRGWDDV